MVTSTPLAINSAPSAPHLCVQELEDPQLSANALEPGYLLVDAEGDPPAEADLARECACLPRLLPAAAALLLLPSCWCPIEPLMPSYCCCLQRLVCDCPAGACQPDRRSTAAYAVLCCS